MKVRFAAGSDKQWSFTLGLQSLDREAHYYLGDDYDAEEGDLKKAKIQCFIIDLSKERMSVESDGELLQHARQMVRDHIASSLKVKQLERIERRPSSTTLFD